MLNSRSSGCGLAPHHSQCIMSLSKTLSSAQYFSTQEDPSDMTEKLLTASDVHLESKHTNRSKLAPLLLADGICTHISCAGPPFLLEVYTVVQDFS